MNAKFLLYFLLVVLISPLLTGCMCTYPIIEKCDQRTVDTFNPSGVYRLTAPTNTFALEGTRKNHLYRDKEPFHAYLFIPDYGFLHTNETLSLGDVENVQKIKSENFPSDDLECKKKLPTAYEKIADLPKNNINIEVKEHHPKAYLALLLPFTFAADVVTFPFQCAYLLGSGGWHT